MRDYVLNYSHSRQAAGPSFWFTERVHNWFARRAIAKLEHYEDHILRDIGVTRDEIRWASHLPLSQNAALALEVHSLHRRRGSRRVE